MSRLLAFSLVLGLLLVSGCVVEQFMEPGAIAVWQQQEDGDWDIRYSLWNDNTKAWYTPAGPVTALIADIGGNDHDPYIDSDGVDTAISVWSHESEGDADIYYSIWKSNAWSKPVPVATLSGYDSDPAVAMDFSGNAVAVWVHKNTDGTTMLYYSTYDGRAWSNPGPVDRGHVKVSLPELSYSSTIGIYFLVWTESTDAGTRAFASGYSGSWVPAVEIPGQKNNAVFDTKVPTDQRIGLGTAGKKREAVAVWPTTNGEIYSSTWTPSGWSTALMYGNDEMPDAEFEYGGVPYSVFIKGRGLHWSKDLYSAGGVTPVPGTGEDYRPALTFIGDRITGLTVFWTTKALPSEIYYGRWDGASWEPVRPIDAATVPGEDRNPDVSPLMKEDQEWDFYIDWCGDGVIQWPNIWGQFEECEVGIPCPNPADWCNNQCLCIPDYGNKTWCGDGMIQRPNSAGVMEECEAGVPCMNPNEKCNLGTCKCEPQDDIPPPPEDGEQPPEDDEYNHMECIEEYCIEMPGLGQDECIIDEDCREGACGNGRIDGNEQCDIGGGLINGVQYGAAKDTCPLSYSCRSDCTCQLGIVTPRCGDGYISGPEQGANEECDTKGGTLPDTCPTPEKCSYICRCEIEQVDDNMHYGCVEGMCMYIEGEGWNECLYDSDCKHYGCEDDMCVLLYYPGKDECYVDKDCQEWHTECRDGACVDVQGLGDDECYVDDDCFHTECVEGLCETVDGPGQNECYYDADCQNYHTECIDGECVDVEGDGDWECLYDEDCVEETYCGDGIVQPEYEECEYDSDCYGEAVCNNCHCIEPPYLDCGYICGQTSGAEVIATGLSSSSQCKSALAGYYDAPTCYTTCTYSWFYRVDNVAGYASCCCGMVKRFPCDDCPGQNPVCPGDSICDQNAPSWYSP